MFCLIRSSLGCADINGSFKLLLAVILKVHELRVPQHEPAHLPVTPRQGGHASSFLVKPARFDRVLLGPKPHKCFVLQDTPAATPRDHETTLMKERRWSRCMLCSWNSHASPFFDRPCRNKTANHNKTPLTFHVEVAMEVWRPAAIQQIHPSI